jgi:hypothetical protein
MYSRISVSLPLIIFSECSFARPSSEIGSLPKKSRPIFGKRLRFGITSPKRREVRLLNAAEDPSSMRNSRMESRFRSKCSQQCGPAMA